MVKELILLLSIIQKYYYDFILHSFWVIGMCWNMCTINQWGWRIWVVLASISPWQALESYNQISRSGFRQKLATSIMFPHSPSLIQPIPLYGTHSLRGVSTYENFPLVSITSTYLNQSHFHYILIYIFSTI